MHTSHRRSAARLPGLAILLALLAPGMVSHADVPVAADLPVAATTHFAFHSDLWVNLHHVLYFQAAREDAAAAGERRRIGVGPDDLAAIDALPEPDRAAWRRAVDLYRRDLIGRDLLFDQGMVALRDALADGGIEALESARPGLDVPPGLAEALHAAEPVYRRHLWPQHDRQNRAWIDATLPWLARLEKPVALELARAWGASFPPAPFRVDVTVHASWASAYTTRDPDRVTLSSLDPAHSGAAAVESLFHEVSHSSALGSGLPALVAEAFAGTGREPGRDFWHLLIFHTAGQLTREALAAAGEPGYEPFALRGGLVARVPGWPAAWAALDAHWLPYLRGEGTRVEALARAARSLAGETAATPR